jgi:hypothetical protein
MAKRTPVRLPLLTILLLAVCLFGLATHLYAESLGISGMPSASTDNAGLSDDHFVPALLVTLQMDELLVTTAPTMALSRAIVSHPPLLPPPNF